MCDDDVICRHDLSISWSDCGSMCIDSYVDVDTCGHGVNCGRSHSKAISETDRVCNLDFSSGHDVNPDQSQFVSKFVNSNAVNRLGRNDNVKNVATQ